MRVTSLAQFEGRWRLDRVIDDRRAGTTATLSGAAEFVPAGDGLEYRETGSLVIAGQPPIRAERRSLWHAFDGGVAVRFADGRPFHTFALGQAVAEATHRCAPDHYAVRYDFAGFPDWQAEWRVTGPRKDYLMTSRYRRAG